MYLKNYEVLKGIFLIYGSVLALSVILFEVLMIIFIVRKLPSWLSIPVKVDDAKTPLITIK